MHKVLIGFYAASLILFVFAGLGFAGVISLEYVNIFWILITANISMILGASTYLAKLYKDGFH